MTKSKDGLTAWEAIRLLSPEPEIAQADMIKSDLELWSGGTTWVDAEYDERLGEALRPVPGVRVLVDRLADGTWYAMGLRAPLDPNKQLENIPAHLWDVLDISPDDNTVSGSGLEYEGVLYYEGEYERRPTAVPAPSAEPFEARRAGRKKGSGSYDQADDVLLTEMERLLETREDPSVWKAAAEVVGKAKGGGTEESKIKRLVKKYGERTPSQ